MPEASVPSFPTSARALAGVPGSGERVVVERPPPGLARGARTASEATVIALAAALVVVLVAYYALQYRKRRGK